MLVTPQMVEYATGKVRAPFRILIEESVVERPGFSSDLLGYTGKPTMDRVVRIFPLVKGPPEEWQGSFIEVCQTVQRLVPSLAVATTQFSLADENSVNVVPVGKARVARPEFRISGEQKPVVKKPKGILERVRGAFRG